MLLNSKNYEEALLKYQTAINKEPLNTTIIVELYVNMAIIYTKIGKCEEAQKYTTKAVELDPENDGLKQLQNAQEQMEKERERIEGDTKCGLCCEKDKEIAFVPCGHFHVCEECSGQLFDCPLCRKVIDKKIRIYQG